MTSVKASTLFYVLLKKDKFMFQLSLRSVLLCNSQGFMAWEKHLLFTNVSGQDWGHTDYITSLLPSQLLLWSQPRVYGNILSADRQKHIAPQNDRHSY